MSGSWLPAASSASVMCPDQAEKPSQIKIQLPFMHAVGFVLPQMHDYAKATGGCSRAGSAPRWLWSGTVRLHRDRIPPSRNGVVQDPGFQLRSPAGLRVQSGGSNGNKSQ